VGTVLTLSHFGTLLEGEQFSLRPSALPHLLVPLLARLGKSLLCFDMGSSHVLCNLGAPFEGRRWSSPSICIIMPCLSVSGSQLRRLTLSSPSDAGSEGYGHLSAAGKI